MTPTAFEGCNTTLAAPKGTESWVQDLPAYVAQDPHHPEVNYFVTAWIPSEEDLKSLNAGKPVYLQCWGGFPPSSLYTVDDKGMPNWMTDQEKQDYEKNNSGSKPSALDERD